MKRRLCSSVSTAVAGVLTVLSGSEAQAKPAWQLAMSEANPTAGVVTLAAVDADYAWGVILASGSMQGGGSFGVRTTNGLNWTDMALPAVPVGPFEILVHTRVAFHDRQVGWLHGVKASFERQYFLWRTDNGGNSWREVLQGKGELQDLQALADGSVFGVGGDVVVRSSDGEQYAQVMASPPSGLGLAGVHMLNRDCGYAVATALDEEETGAAVLWTGDGGQTWEVRAQAADLRMSKLWFVSADLGWVAAERDGAGVVAKTRDGGRTWEDVVIPDHPAVSGSASIPVEKCLDVRFFDDQRGVTMCVTCLMNCEPPTDPSQPPQQASYITTFLRTSDGGRTWSFDPDYEPAMTVPMFPEAGKYTAMRTMSFPEPNTGFLGGDNVMILRYLAESPEPAGWGAASCEPGTTPGSGGGAGGAGSGSGSAGGAGTAGVGTSGPQASTFDSNADSGCGCALPGRIDREGIGAGVLLGVVWAGRRRRRRAER